MKDSHVTLAVLVLTFSSVSMAIYLISDYYMDDGWPSSFGQVCGDTVGDDCAYINSHLNTFGFVKYDSDISCTMMFDAGKQTGASYKFIWKRFDLEESVNCTSDALTMYDAHMNNVTAAVPFGAFCGGNDPNTTGFPSQRFVTFKFKTDGGTAGKGFRALAIRTVPYPCPSDDFFHCKGENRCIDSRLHCDGTVQCQDETDEDGCSFFEKMIGGFLALGIAGIIGIVGSCLTFCITVGVIICIFKCCRKQCGCLFRCFRKCCNKLRKPQNLKSGKVGVASDDVELADVEDTAVETATAGVAIAAVKKSGTATAGVAIAAVKKSGTAQKATTHANDEGTGDEVTTARDVVLKNVDDDKSETKAPNVAAKENTTLVKEMENQQTGDSTATSAENKTTTGLRPDDPATEVVPKVDTQ